MNDIRRVNRQFLANFISALGIAFAIVFGMIAANIWIPDANIQYLIYFFSLIAIMFIGAFFKVKLDRITQLSYLVKIRASQGGPLPMNHTKKPDDMPEHLKTLGYELFAQDLEHALYHRINKDPIGRSSFSRYTLEIVVLVNQRQNVFYLEQVDQEISNLQQKYLKERKKLDHMLITQMKEVGILDERTKDLIKEIIFVRSNWELFKPFRTVISTLNVGIYRAEGVAVMLYSDTYRPSLYYEYHINEVKKII